ncbi:hypothetical protein TNCV_4764021 [Trichonephila clavipes]|nr:hypothetical protein TNCV_4764021 [Trichonephila clavipes]
MLYHRMVLEPHTANPIPAGTRYILLTVQRLWTLSPKPFSPSSREKGLNLGNFRKIKWYDQKSTSSLLLPRFMYVQRQTKRPLVQNQGLPSKRNRVFITPVIRPPVLIARPSTALATPQSIPVFQPPVQISPVPTTPPVQIPGPPPELTTPFVQIPDPPVQIPPVQIPPVPALFTEIHQLCRSFYQIHHPVVETLESTLMDDSSMDQIMSSVFGDCSQLPPAHTQEPRLLDTVPSLFVDSDDLIWFLDNFETGLAIEQQEAPMDLTMP